MHLHTRLETRARTRRPAAPTIVTIAITAVRPVLIRTVPRPRRLRLRDLLVRRPIEELATRLRRLARARPVPPALIVPVLRLLQHRGQLAEAPLAVARGALGGYRRGPRAPEGAGRRGSRGGRGRAVGPFEEVAASVVRARPEEAALVDGVGFDRALDGDVAALALRRGERGRFGCFGCCGTP